MAHEWFFARGGVQEGPVSAERLRELIARGELTREDIVWREGLPQWTPVCQVHELLASGPSTGAPPQPSAREFDRAATLDAAPVEPHGPQTIAGLYALHNRIHKQHMLFSIFGNAVVLNRALDDSPSMVELPEKLRGLDAERFATHKKVREATLKKLMQMSMALPEMKQSLELSAILYPYFWVEREAKWLERVFGAGVAARLMVSERRRLIPALRRQIRTCQANIQRPLAEIESALRPIEEVLAREEVQQHWSSKVRRFLPGIAQAVIGVAFMSTGGGAVIGGRMVAGAVAIHGLGGVLGHFEKDRYAAAQLRRAALRVLPWWQLFLNSLSVSLYETAEALDEESNRSMARDRKLVDAVPAGRRQQVLQRLATALRDGVSRESKLENVELVQGLGLCWKDVVGDMNVYMRDHLQKRVRVFTSGFELPGASLEQGG